MKLLFDANLSPKLVNRLAGLFPRSAHVFETAMARSTSDELIWEYAKANAFTIVTADSDFLHLAQFRGTPPKLVRLDNVTASQSPKTFPSDNVVKLKSF